MRGLGYDRIVAGTALALVLALTQGALAQPDMLDAGVPMPARETLPPPTAADVTNNAVTNSTNALTLPAASDPAPVEAAPEAAPPDPLASLDPADRPIA